MAVALFVGHITISKAAASEQYPDIANMLRKYDLSAARNLAGIEDLEDDYAEEESAGNAIVDDVKNALLHSMLQGDEEEGGLLAAMMQDDEDKATAQFRFFRGIFKNFGQTPFGKSVRSGLCRSYGKK